METTCGWEQAGSSSFASTHKKRKMSIPVYVVEDHNEALYYIYRGIGSKKLPFSGGTIIHFDSHPDLLLPKKLQAEKIRNKEYVLSAVSIENWILPMVFAGHITTIVWIKPPWAHQIADGTHHFTIGCHEELNEIKLTCPEPYFVSELLYAPISELRQIVDACLVVQTLETALSPEGSGGKSSEEGERSRIVTKQPGATSHQSDVESCLHRDAGASSTSDRSVPKSPEEDRPASGKHPFGGAGERSAESSVSTTEQLGLTGKPVIVGAAGDTERSTCLGPLPGLPISEVGALKTPSAVTPTLVTAARKGDGRDPYTDPPPSPPRASVVQTAPPPDPRSSDPLTFPTAAQQVVSPGQSYLLDIDLDFYSTRNPFRILYSESQFEALRDLYRFQLPSSTSVQDLQVATCHRRLQLEETEAMLMHVKAGGSLEEFPDSARRQQIQQLLSTFHDRPVDFDLLHDAGCTCDDTELPHHVSCREEILQMIDVTKRYLQTLPPPAVITVARSSRDDYCPPEDVDFIQDCVLKMLEEVFGELDVTCDYGEEEEQE